MTSTVWPSAPRTPPARGGWTTPSSRWRNWRSCWSSCRTPGPSTGSSAKSATPSGARRASSRRTRCRTWSSAKAACSTAAGRAPTSRAPAPTRRPARPHRGPPRGRNNVRPAQPTRLPRPAGPAGQDQRSKDQRAQNAMRRALGELMQRFGDLTGQVPAPLGEAEHRDARRRSGDGRRPRQRRRRRTSSGRSRRCRKADAP